MKFLVALTCLLAIATAKAGFLHGHADLGLAAGHLGHLASPGFGYSSIATHAGLAAPALAHHGAVAHHAALAAPLASVAHHAAIAAPVAAVAHHAAYAAPIGSVAHHAALAAPAIAHHAAYAAPVASVAHHAALAAPAIAHHAAYAAPVASVAHHAALAAPAIAHHAGIVTPALAHHAAYAAPVASVAHHAALAHHVAAPIAYSAPVAHAIALEKTQYHAQDVLGQSSYGHSEAFQQHHAVQDAAGNKLGSYSWVAPNGQVIAGKYVADALGYRVHSNAVPVGPAPVGETPEVIAARSAHYAAHIAAKTHHHHLVRRGILATPAIGYTAAIATPVHYTSHYTHGLVSPIVHHATALNYGSIW